MSRARLPFLLLLIAWPLFLALQEGDAFDEAEHCHAAWMMGRMHQRPLVDFFQHHTPLLWDLLKTYYLVGGEGPEVMYFGRALVAVCALLFALGAFLLARNWARGQDGAASPGLFGCVLGVAPVLLLSMAVRQVLVIRPETVSLAAFGLALACWTWPTGAGRWAGVVGGLLAGVLFGAAVYASPRFALLSGAFVLLPSDRRRLFSVEIVPLAAAVAGAVAFVGGYQLLSTGRLYDLYFNLEFSALTYKAGGEYFRLQPHLFVFAGEALLVGAWVFLRLDGPGRRRFLVHAAYLLLATGAALTQAWPIPYPQNFIAPAAWMGVMFACAAPRMEAIRAPARPGAAPRWALVVAGVCLLLTLRDLVTWNSILTRVEHKRELLALLRPGEPVLLAPVFHPICVMDATYYGTLIVDDENHWAKSVALARRQSLALPDCDYLSDVLARKPALVDDFMVRILPEPDRARFLEILDREYTPVRPFPSYHQCFRRNERAAAAAFPYEREE